MKEDGVAQPHLHRKDLSSEKKIKGISNNHEGTCVCADRILYKVSHTEFTIHIISYIYNWKGLKTSKCQHQYLTFNSNFSITIKINNLHYFFSILFCEITD